jgi:hypothetical protein
VNRSERVNLTVAAVVSAVLPNGNMVIQGRQEVRTNSELRELTVAGVVRPEDISSANTIRHTQIAEARISYGGRGDISRVQKTPAGQALVEQFLPLLMETSVTEIETDREAAPRRGRADRVGGGAGQPGGDARARGGAELRRGGGRRQPDHERCDPRRVGDCSRRSCCGWRPRAGFEGDTATGYEALVRA